MVTEQKLVSTLDNSVNFVLSNGLECRFVQREPDYFIIYVSSQTGCAKACRFCHLTQTKQTTDVDATYDQILDQVDTILTHWNNSDHKDKDKVTKIHVNFMARGEPLSNKMLMKSYRELFDDICFLIEEDTGIKNIRFKISTIIPVDVDQEALRGMVDPRIDFYYSLYSIDTNFRKKWLPKALDFLDVLPLIKDKKSVTFHHALIKGENDSIEEAKNITWFASLFDYTPKVNLIQYNPFSTNQGQEADPLTIEKYADHIRNSKVFGRIKIIKRIGLDVKASCGMFVNNLVKIAKNESK